MIIGITGGTGCGKSTALDVIRQMGGTVLDCDAIYHALLQSDSDLISAISRQFPGTVENGMLHRKKLGQIVFADRAALEKLNRITHEAVKREVCRRLQEPAELIAIDAIALFEVGLSELCDVTVAVTAPYEQRVSRLINRESISEAYAKLRIDAQPSQEEFIRLCDYHIANDGTKEQFRDKCLAFLANLGIMKTGHIVSE